MQMYLIYILINKKINRRQYWQWMVLDLCALGLAGMLETDCDFRKRWAEWAVKEFFGNPLPFNIVLHILSGDMFYEQNKRDVAALEKKVGKRITELWDTNPIFNEYPNLRGLARNAEFEKMWAKMKSKLQDTKCK